MTLRTTTGLPKDLRPAAATPYRAAFYAKLGRHLDHTPTPITPLTHPMTRP